MSDPAGQTYPSVRDEIDALKAELAAEREAHFEHHPEARAIYEADAAKDLPTLRRELTAEREAWEAERRRGWADR